MPNLKFSVTSKSENPTKTVVEARDFKIVIDEPENLGGTNDGPNPVEYVLAALSGCLNVVGHLVAKEMGFELKGIEFELEGDLDPAKFSGQDTDTRAGYQEIRVNIKPDTNADEDTLSKWLEAVETRCPVSDNLANATPVKISLG
ncbi:OsmC family protein [Halothermothrix orenii]|uniref:OsmC family protein n=1 Tax=Halothermothrix orenii (strain H 168 / OCM 544 / DSM 9562) TaxID=373903 RepID=B8D210_HALOH|nr:OsmC family protein [Halothermothrix orenii]ACL69237.1 OsmC family protein [Halothermothrix orenii H 168]